MREPTESDKQMYLLAKFTEIAQKIEAGKFDDKNIKIKNKLYDIYADFKIKEKKVIKNGLD